MKLIGRTLVEGTVPKMAIGHRQYKKKDGTVYISRQYTTEYCFQGKHRQESLGTPNKQVAIARAHAIAARIQSGIEKPPAYKTTVTELAKQYLEYVVNKGVSFKTAEKYTYVTQIFSQWCEQFGRNVAVRFAPRDLQAFRKFMADNGKTAKTIYDRLVVVKQIFKWGWREKLLPEYGLAGVTIPRPAPREQPCFTPQQIPLLLQKAYPHEKPIFAVMAYTGMRFGEVRDLLWEDIHDQDGDASFIHIKRGGWGGLPKNKRPRKIPLHPELRPYLAAMPRNGEQVFRRKPKKQYPEGRPLDEGRTLLALKRLCKRCGFPDWKRYKLHTFRHTFASMCARNNVAYKYALDWLGHSDSKILDHYYSAFDDVAQAAMRTISFVATSSAASGANAASRTTGGAGATPEPLEVGGVDEPVSAELRGSESAGGNEKADSSLGHTEPSSDLGGRQNLHRGQSVSGPVSLNKNSSV